LADLKLLKTIAMKKLFTILTVGAVLVACNNAPDTSVKASDTVGTMAAKADSAAMAAKDTSKMSVDTSKTMKMDTTVKK
jgi:uncharacterized protein YcfL